MKISSARPSGGFAGAVSISPPLCRRVSLKGSAIPMGLVDADNFRFAQGSLNRPPWEGCLKKLGRHKAIERGC